MTKGRLYIGLMCLSLLMASLAFSGEMATANNSGGGNPGSQLLKNLQTAYATETSERASYLAFAMKADNEGYGQVGSLFRALARAEEIHSQNKAKLIGLLGGTLEGASDAISVGSTKDNIAWALDAEKYEKETMYPDFAAQSIDVKDTMATRAFRYCLAGETKHIQTLKQAQLELANYKGGSVPFHVCPVCGNTVRSLSFTACPVCNEPKANFESIQ